MQRLFSSFARGLPGAGLLLLRLAISTSLVAYSISALLSTGSAAFGVLGLLMLAAAILLLLGLWTPIAGVLAALSAVWHGGLDPSYFGNDALLGSVGIAVSLLGPGAWSVDAHMFGWKRLEIETDAAEDDSLVRDDTRPQ